MSGTMMLNRRDFLGASALALASIPAQTLSGPSSRVVPYGAAIHHESFWKDTALRAAVAANCDQITIESSLKMEYVLANPERYDFSLADTLAGWAIQHELGVHGHPLIWYAALPPWVEQIASAVETEALLSRHIETLIDRFGHVVRTWDVVNEALPDYPRQPDELRDCIWLAHLGRDYVAEAFHRARAADPRALLVLNEYDIELAVENGPVKREAFRQLVLRLLDAGAPIDAIGFQAHLQGGLAIAEEEVSALAAEMASYGLEILVTELDVIDTNLPGDEVTRDRLVADHVDSFLSALADGARIKSISTWGLTDQHSWIRWILPRPDGLQSRPLPLDWDYHPKPFMDVLQRHLAATGS